MDQLFGSMYCTPFEHFFGIELANYLWGQSSPLSQTNQFIGIGLSMLGISLAVAVIYYYVINHPRLNNLWGWLIFIAINAAINFFLGWDWVMKDFYEDKMVTIDPATNLRVPLNIGETDIIFFGVSNMLLSIVAFFLFSCCIKWWSRNCSRTPF